MTTLTADSVRDELVQRLDGLSAGDVSVTSVQVDDDFWPDDERSVKVVVRLSDPVGETWGLEETDIIRQQVIAAFAALDIGSRVRFRFAGGQPPEDAAPVPDDA